MSRWCQNRCPECHQMVQCGIRGLAAHRWTPACYFAQGYVSLHDSWIGYSELARGALHKAGLIRPSPLGVWPPAVPCRTFGSRTNEVFAPFWAVRYVSSVPGWSFRADWGPECLQRLRRMRFEPSLRRRELAYLTLRVAVGA